MSNDWEKQAGRIRELSRDRAARTYLLGWFCAQHDASELEDLVQGALVYRERFGASGDLPVVAFATGMMRAQSPAVSTDTPERGGRQP